MNKPLLRFLRGYGTDHRGRSITAILAMSDGEWESCHDFIQWLFPLPEPSRFNPDAPLLDDETRAFLLYDTTTASEITRAVRRVLAFLELSDPLEVRHNCPRWWTKGNHNHLRVSRLLRFLSLIGRASEARALFGHLAFLDICYPGVISQETRVHWAMAARGKIPGVHCLRCSNVTPGGSVFCCEDCAAATEADQ